MRVLYSMYNLFHVVLFKRNMYYFNLIKSFRGYVIVIPFLTNVLQYLHNNINYTRATIMNEIVFLSFPPIKVHKYSCVSSDAIHVHMPRLCSSLSNNLFLGIRVFKIKSYAILKQTTKK